MLLNHRETKHNRARLMPKTNNGDEIHYYIHFAHEHPLELAAASETTTTCSGCNWPIAPGKNFYACKACSYSLHGACFKMPSLCRHPADPDHDLTLLPLPSFVCKACGIQGSGHCYSCRTCLTNHHTLCLRMPLLESCALHEHILKLEFSPPYGTKKGFRCDVCGKKGSNHWLYRCSNCDFDVHLNCVYAVPSSQS